MVVVVSRRVSSGEGDAEASTHVSAQAAPRHHMVTEYNSVVRVYSNSHNSRVCLLSSGKIKKTYPKTPEGIGQYKNEKAVYELLADEYFVPRLIGFNNATRSLYIEKVGGPPPRTQYWEKELSSALAVIRKRLHVKRTSPYKWGNICHAGKQIYLVDYGKIPVHTQISGSNWSLTK
jgi:hypothetical protein